MPKYIKKPYEVLEGEVDKEPPVQKWERYHDRLARENRERGESTTLIVPPNNGTSGPPIPLLRYRMINAAKDAGMDIGVDVIRVIHMNESMIDNPRFIGKIDRFTFDCFPGETEYRPVIVRFSISGTAYQDFPFRIEEIEVHKKAKEYIDRVKTPPMKAQETIGEEIIKDLMRQRNGVLPFRHEFYGD